LVVDNQQVYYHHSVYGLDKWIFMAAADAFIHLSYRENFCYSVAEAAALGLPLIISDGIDIHPILEEAGGADVITIDSEEDIHKGLAKFLDKSEMEQKAMGERAKKVFQENFCQSVFQDRLVKLIKKYARENHF
jgi:glycosyltransferase involved in cell wall biosynthesis